MSNPIYEIIKEIPMKHLYVFYLLASESLNRDYDTSILEIAATMIRLESEGSAQRPVDEDEKKRKVNILLRQMKSLGDVFGKEKGNKLFRSYQPRIELTPFGRNLYRVVVPFFRDIHDLATVEQFVRIGGSATSVSIIMDTQDLMDESFTQVRFVDGTETELFAFLMESSLDTAVVSKTTAEAHKDEVELGTSVKPPIDEQQFAVYVTRGPWLPSNEVLGSKATTWVELLNRSLHILHFARWKHDSSILENLESLGLRAEKEIAFRNFPNMARALGQAAKRQQAAFAILPQACELVLNSGDFWKLDFPVFRKEENLVQFVVVFRKGVDDSKINLIERYFHSLRKRIKTEEVNWIKSTVRIEDDGSGLPGASLKKFRPDLKSKVQRKPKGSG